MNLFNDILDEFFTKKGIVAFISGSAGGMIYGTSVEKRRTIMRFLGSISTGGITATFGTGWVAETVNATTPEQERLIAFFLGVIAMVLWPNVVSFVGRIRFKVPKVFSSVAEDAGNE